LPGVVFWVNVLGCFTGAHTNAMITTSWVFKSNKPFNFTAKVVSTYILSQVAGVFTGGLFLKFMYSKFLIIKIKLEHLK
jgi:glycerol uptake facilitator-like aquaporin